MGKCVDETNELDNTVVGDNNLLPKNAKNNPMFAMRITAPSRCDSFDFVDMVNNVSHEFSASLDVKSHVQSNDIDFNASNEWLLAIVKRAEWHYDRNMIFCVILCIDSMRISSITFNNFIKMLLLMHAIWFDPVDDMLKNSAKIVKLLLFLCSLTLLIPLLSIGNK